MTPRDVIGTLERLGSRESLVLVLRALLLDLPEHRLPPATQLLLGATGSVELRVILSSIVARAVAAGFPVGVHAYSGEEAAGYAAEGATIVTVAVDAVALGEAVAHHLAVERDARHVSGERPTRSR